MNAVSPIIETDRLTRDFKSATAVDELTLSIAPGELFGLVGPDGAGKTTTLRLLAGLLDVSDGEATEHVNTTCNAAKRGCISHLTTMSTFALRTILSSVDLVAALMEPFISQRIFNLGRRWRE